MDQYSNADKINAEYERIKKAINLDKIDRAARQSKIAGVVILPVMFLLFVAGMFQLRTLSKDIDGLKMKKDEATRQYNALLTQSKALEDKKRELESDLASRFGVSVNDVSGMTAEQIVQASMSANAAIKNIATAYTASPDVEVRYYEDKLLAIDLEALGYANAKQLPKMQNMKKRDTNAVWFGKSVPIEDVRLVSLALIRAGIQIRGIQLYERSKTDSTYKKNVIEIGSSVRLQNSPILSVDEVLKAKEFPL